MPARLVLGALPLYYLDKVIGEERLKTWADKHGKWLTVSREDIEKSKDWFDRHGAIAVIIGRLVPGIRSLTLADFGARRHRPNELRFFLLYTAIGAGILSSLLAYLGFLLGGNYEKVEKYLSPASYVVLGIVVLVYIYRVVQQNRKEAASTA